jgi:hypothetical protein
MMRFMQFVDRSSRTFGVLYGYYSVYCRLSHKRVMIKMSDRDRSLWVSPRRN